MQTQQEIISALRNSLEEAHTTLEESLSKLEREYGRIVGDGKKEADKLERQLVGSADLEVRNKQLMLVEESVKRVFDTAIEKIQNADRDDTYAKMVAKMLQEAIEILRTSQVTVFTNSNDHSIVSRALSSVPEAHLSPDPIKCMGGVLIKSQDGSMTFDNTIDAKLERIKPLIRKEIASKFGIGS